MLAVILVLYNVLVLAAPFPKNAGFFLGWTFTMIAIFAQVYVARTAFPKGGSVKSKFYGFPIAKIGVVYLVVQLAAGLMFMALGTVVPLWLPLVLYVALLGASAIGLVSSDATREEIERQDAKLVKDISRMRDMQSRIISIVSQAKEKETIAALTKFAEDLRFSDPVSSEALQEIEANLSACIDEIQAAVIDGDEASIFELCKRQRVSW